MINTQPIRKMAKVQVWRWWSWQSVSNATPRGGDDFAISFVIRNDRCDRKRNFSGVDSLLDR